MRVTFACKNYCTNTMQEVISAKTPSGRAIRPQNIVTGVAQMFIFKKVYFSALAMGFLLQYPLEFVSV